MRSLLEAPGDLPYAQRRKATVYYDRMRAESIDLPQRRPLQTTRYERYVVRVPRVADADFIFSWGSEIFVSPLAVDVLESRVSGVRFRPVTLVDSPHRDALYDLTVDGYVGFPPAHKINVYRDRIDRIGLYRFALRGAFSGLLVPAKDDGSDVSIVWPLPLYPMVSARFRELTLRYGLSGVAFLAVDEEDAPTSVSPGLPSAFLRPESVRELHADPDYLAVIGL